MTEAEQFTQANVEKWCGIASSRFTLLAIKWLINFANEHGEENAKAVIKKAVDGSSKYKILILDVNIAAIRL